MAARQFITCFAVMWGSGLAGFAVVCGVGRITMGVVKGIADVTYTADRVFSSSAGSYNPVYVPIVFRR